MNHQPSPLHDRSAILNSNSYLQAQNDRCSIKESVPIPPMRLSCCNLNALIYVVMVMVMVVVVVSVLADNLFKNSTSPACMYLVY
jgi:hypothetical protein